MPAAITQKPNRLSQEKSPYLLQHQYNPVDWFPWGEEAFRKAKAEDKPVFLSIGYSTCHWCHVMAHESFEDPEVAEVLNRDFVSVKVDREERPDVDAVYMAVCQSLNGTGGWPLTILMTPEQKPFWAGTYLPKTAQYGWIGLLELLPAVARQWKEDRASLLSSGEEIAAQLGAREMPKPSEPEKELLHMAADFFRQTYDPLWGGFGPAPKFPAAHNLLFLLRYSALERDEGAREMAEHTLIQMYRGGIFDHLGGGFSRYSTDSRWLVPHFEKMLYDNALLTQAYLEAYHMTRRPLYRTVAERTLRYLLRELRDPLGGFLCGQDADSDGAEGKFYVFTPDEIRQVLGGKDADRFCARFAVTEQGNFDGKSIPNRIDDPEYETPDPALDALCETLRTYRSTRATLHRDDKVLTSWTSLAIAALARAGRLLDEPDFLQAAVQAQHFIEEHLAEEGGRLHLRWREGESAYLGQLDDYAFYSLALLELYRSTFEPCYLRQAAETAEQMVRLFSDPAGGFFLSPSDAEPLITRPKELYDGALPCGNSAAALVLCRLTALTGETVWRERRNRQLYFLSGAARESPVGHSGFLLALLEVLYPSRELLCASAEQEAPAPLLDLLRETYVPNLSVLLKTPRSSEELREAAPFTIAYPTSKKAQYFLCRDGACAAPVKSTDELRRLLLS